MPGLYHLVHLESVNQQLPAKGVQDLPDLCFQKSLGKMWQYIYIPILKVQTRTERFAPFLGAACF